MRLAFLGTGRFAVPALEAVLDGGHDVAALVTQPDRESGRGRELAPPPTKVVALSRGLAVQQPRRIRLPEAVAALAELRPEILVVVAYGQILPPTVLGLAPRGAVNVHASLLPRYRGAAPIQWALARGESETGVTTMQLDEGLDTGPILVARSTPIGPEETAGELQERLAALGARLLLETLAGLADERLSPRPQDHALATPAPILRKEDGRVDWSLPAREIGWRVRGFHPWPGTTAAWQGRGLKLLRVSAGEPAPAQPGQVLVADSRGVLVGCGAGTTLWLSEVQPESRRAMPAGAWAAGARVRAGDRFD